MISHITGTIIHTGLELGFVVLDVNGVGYKIHVTNEAFKYISSSKDSVSLWTHLAVRENSLELFGFKDKEEMDFFEMLISISGIGPKSALSIVNLESVKTLTSAIAQGDTSYLTKVSGIGRKSAEKIILELKDKVGIISEEDNNLHSEDVDSIEALRTLGYSTKEARDALKSISKEITGTQHRLKEALRLLGTR